VIWWNATFPKQSNDVRSPALVQVCNSVCGSRTKKLGDRCSRTLGAHVGDESTEFRSIVKLFRYCCSALAPRSSAAKKWIERKEPAVFWKWIAFNLQMHAHSFCFVL